MSNEEHRMSGPRPTPTAILRLRGSELGDRPDEPQPVRDAPRKPDHLNKLAGEVWEWLCGTLEGMGLLVQSDVAIMAIYCETWADYVANRTALSKEELGPVLISQKTAQPYMSPLFMIDATLKGQLLKIMAELGLTASARTRINVHPTAGPAAVQKRNRRA